MHQYVLNLVCLLDLDAHTYTVDAGLDEDLFIFIAGHGQRIEEDFGGAGCFNLGDIVAFRGLRCEIGEGESGCEGGADTLEIWAERLRLDGFILACGLLNNRRVRIDHFGN